MDVLDPTVPTVKSLLLLDSDGKRIAVKYFSSEWCAERPRGLPLVKARSQTGCLWPHAAAAAGRRWRRRPAMRSQSSRRPAGPTRVARVSTQLVSARLRCSRAEAVGALCAAEITMFDDVIVVYKFVADLMFFVTGSQDDNELILQAVLQAFYESVSLLLRWARRVHSSEQRSEQRPLGSRQCHLRASEGCSGHSARRLAATPPWEDSVNASSHF